MIDPEILSWQATALSVVPFLVWIASLDDQALQFPAYHLRPPYSLAILGNVASSGLNDDRTRRIARGLAVAQVRGTLSDTLHYDVYTGIIPGDYADTLVSGARIGYTFGTSGLTLGVNYGYTLRDTRRQTLERLAGRPGNLANNTYYRLFGVDLLYDKGNLSLAQRIVYGVDADEGRSLAVFTQPALRLNQQWTIFYRFDYLSFGQGMPKSVEHVMGAKFLSTAYLRFKAEFMVQEVNDPPIEGWGFRLVATVQF
jgi:hypothetical protein